MTTPYARKWGDEADHEDVQLGPVHVPAHDVAPVLGSRSGPALFLKAVTDQWVHRILRARGPMVVTVKEQGRDGKNHNVHRPRIVDSLAVRLRRVDGLRAVAVWIDGKSWQAWLWPECQDPACPRGTFDHPAELPQAIGITELRKIVNEPRGT